MPTLIKNGKNYSGTSVSLTQTEYDALTETQKNDGTVYFITDSDAVLDASDVSVGSGTVEDSIGSIAVIETSPATSAHAVGTYLVYNGKLYKVTSAISANEQLVVGTNIVATTVGDELGSGITPSITALNSNISDFTNNSFIKNGVLCIRAYFHISGSVTDQTALFQVSGISARKRSEGMIIVKTTTTSTPTNVIPVYMPENGNIIQCNSEKVSSTAWHFLIMEVLVG